MKASEAVKVAAEILASVSSYAHLARDWDIEKEDDFDELKDEIIDILADAKDS